MEEQPRSEVLLARLASVRALRQGNDKVYQAMDRIGMATPEYTSGYVQRRLEYQALENRITRELEQQEQQYV